MAEMNSKPYGIVYCVEHRASGRRYVGQTTRSLATRWSGHQRDPFCVMLHRAILKYGPDAFDISVLDTGDSKEDLDAREVFFIEFFMSNRREYGFNLMSGGSFGKHSDASRKKMSEKVRAAYERPETRARLSAALLGKKHSPDRVAKVAAALTGKKATAEHKAKLSVALTGLWRDPAAREKMRQASIAARVSDDYKEKVAENTKAQWQDADARAKLLAAQAAGKAAFWADPEKRAARIAKRRETIERKKAELAAN
jgi:group I intron endonuclease